MLNPAQILNLAGLDHVHEESSSIRDRCRMRAAARGLGKAGGCPPPDDGFSCNGNLIQVGNTIDRVFETCGPPLGGSQQCDAWGHHCSGSWVYRPADGDFPRYVGFSDDVVRSIRAGSRFARSSLP